MLRKPVKRSEHIRKLSREYHFALLFCWKIRQGLKTGVAIERIGKYVQYFWLQHLQPHFREEENILFASVKDTRIERAKTEHILIKLQVGALTNSQNNITRKQLVKFADMVDEHVRYEERDLFPHLERKLSKEQLENIGNLLHKHHSSLQDQYEDQFWNNR